MAGAMRKMAVYLGLVEDDQFEDDYYYGDSSTDARESGRDERDEPRAGARERSSSRGYEPRRADSVRVEESGEAPAGRGTSDSVARPTRNWRVDTVAQEPIAAHPAGSRARAKGGSRHGVGASDMKIITLHPRSYNDARRIGEDYRSGTPVIMNLTDLEDTDAKRIVDFAAGLVFGLRGSIERVTNKVFLLSPANVDVTEEARAQLAQDGLVQR